MTEPAPSPVSSATASTRSIVARLVLFSLPGGAIAGALYGALVIVLGTLVGGFSGDSSVFEVDPAAAFGILLFGILCGGVVGFVLGIVAAVLAGVAALLTARMRRRRAAQFIVGASASLAGWLLLWYLAKTVVLTPSGWIWLVVHIGLALAIVPVYMSVQARVDLRPLAAPFARAKLRTQAKTPVRVEPRPQATDPARLEPRARMRPMRIATRWVAPVFGAAYLLVDDPLRLEQDATTAGDIATAIILAVLFGAVGGFAVGWLLLRVTAALISRWKRFDPVTVGFVVGAIAALSVIMTQGFSIADAGDPGPPVPLIAALIAGAGIAWASWGSASGRCGGVSRARTPRA